MLNPSLLCAVSVACGLASFAMEAGAQVFEPAGELRTRIAMVHARMAKGVDPSFTDDFILADVILSPDYPRRFMEYSGDISGRYIGALACMPDEVGFNRLEGLVAKLIEQQREDGRFGAANLSFAAPDIADLQMALLWGNGRLLTGLLEYHAVAPSPETLASARKLGDFLCGVYETCTDPEVAKRVQGSGASGFICFTQLIEGLNLLYHATSDEKYLTTAKSIVPYLEPRGVQHSHGYLSTLRGYMMLHTTTGDRQFLDATEKAYHELVSSSDYNAYGGVFEYFGGKGDNDEGCSESDFLRVSLQLWRATGNAEYLELAERCLMNIFFAGQFTTGDFGHRRYNNNGVITSDQVGRAWWCCTMHGLRALRDVVDNTVTLKDGVTLVNLFMDGTWTSEDLSLAIERPSHAVAGGNTPQFRINVVSSGTEQKAIAIRKPTWADAFAIRVNGEEVSSANEAGYVTLARQWKQGDVIDVYMDYAARLLTRDGKSIALADMPDGPIEAALMYGPWVMAVNEEFNPLYFGAPLSNTILLPKTLTASDVAAQSPLMVGDARIQVEYSHAGFPDLCKVTLSPISEQTLHRPAIVTAWLRFAKRQ